MIPVIPSAEEKPPAPKTLEVGSGGGFFQPSALLQFWTVYSHQETAINGKPPVSDEDTFNFRLRRAELRIKGDILPKAISYQLMIDAARVLEAKDDKTVPSPLSAMQDFFITFSTDYVDISAGQFKIPVSMEGLGSSSKILFPERALVSRFYGDKRDIGLRLEKKIGDFFGYSAGIYNGAGQNKPDDDTEKDAALRLEVYPFEGITVAAVGYTTVGKRSRSSRDRVEADIKYDAHNIYLIGEYIYGWDTKNDGPATKGHGGYVQAAYTLFGHLQPMVRVGDLEKNTDKKNDHTWHYEGGVNWLFHKNEAKLGLSVSFFDPSNDGDPKNNPKKIEGILAAQASF